MTGFDRYVLRLICKKLVVQGSTHESNIVEYYRIMKEVAKQEFTEDNKPTLDSFLAECHQKSLKE